MGIAKFLLDKEQNEDLKEFLKDEDSEESGWDFKSVLEKVPYLKNLPEDRKYPVINNMFTIYSKDMEVSKKDADLDEFADWIIDSGTPGQFIFDFKVGDSGLSVKNMEALGLLDPEFIRAAHVYGTRYYFIDKEGNETVSVDKKLDNGKTVETTIDRPVKDADLFNYIFDDACCRTSQDRQSSRLDKNLVNDALFEIEDIYKKHLTEGKEEIESVNDEPIETTTEVKPEEGTSTVSVEKPIEPSKEVIKATYGDMINGVVNDTWDLISSINAIIANIEYDFGENKESIIGNKESIIDLLNEIVDSNTINIGILQKIISLIDIEKARLINKGEEKAEKKIGE